MKANKQLKWSKNLPIMERRRIILQANDSDILATAQELQRIANTTHDENIKLEASKDAKFFITQYYSRIKK